MEAKRSQAWLLPHVAVEAGDQCASILVFLKGLGRMAALQETVPREPHPVLCNHVSSLDFVLSKGLRRRCGFHRDIKINLFSLLRKFLNFTGSCTSFISWLLLVELWYIYRIFYCSIQMDRWDEFRQSALGFLTQIHRICSAGTSPAPAPSSPS